MKSSDKEEIDELISIIYHQVRQLISAVIGIEILTSNNVSNEIECWSYANQRYCDIIEILKMNKNSLTFLDNSVLNLNDLPSEVLNQLNVWTKSFAYMPKNFNRLFDSNTSIGEEKQKDLCKGNNYYYYYL